MSNKDKIIYWVSTGLITALMLFSATMYVINNEMVREVFANLGYPTYIIYPLATAKILGLIALWTKKSKVLKEWAYAGFFFDLVLAALAHINADDGGFGPALIGIILLLVSYVYDRKIFSAEQATNREN
ncbi:MAG: DoxX family protein [Cyclobacteriaceae bacterium]